MDSGNCLMHFENITNEYIYANVRLRPLPGAFIFLNGRSIFTITVLEHQGSHLIFLGTKIVKENFRDKVYIGVIFNVTRQ